MRPARTSDPGPYESLAPPTDLFTDSTAASAAGSDAAGPTEAPPIERPPSMMSAIESVRRLPTNRIVFPYVKIMHAMEGAVEVQTERSAHLLSPGMALALGGDRWCRMLPRSRVRLWTIYADESFMRTQMAWLLPVKDRVRSGVHPHEWDGRPLVLHPGMAALRRVEPLWRTLELIHEGTVCPETVAVRTIEILARWVSVVLPAILNPDCPPCGTHPARPAVAGHLTDHTTVGQVGRATRLLRERMDEPWTATVLAREVALSRTHLTRLFSSHVGVSPMRFLTEVRLTEFTRLVEETDFSVARAANTVGWSDPRVASTWFSRRFGITPSQFRLKPHPHRTDAVSAVPATAHDTGESIPSRLAV